MKESKQISAKKVFEIIQPFVKKKRIIPFLIFGIDLFVFLLIFYSILKIDNVLIKFSLGVIEGFLISFLFVIGHDCCHNSFTSNRKLNLWIGNIAFLPSLHNFSLWEIFHNKIHHGYTNLKNKDFVYTPLSPNEYLALSPLHRLKYRIYRSSFGHLPYYLYEMWWKKMLLPNKKTTHTISSKKYWLNVIPLLIYIVVAFSIVIIFSVESGQDLLLNIFFALIIPFCSWNWLIGFAVYQHHTNLFTKWYVREDEWNYWEVQIENSTHIEFPKPINQLFHNIMEHTAHHSNMDIPLYNLGRAQNAIEIEFKSRVKKIKWSWEFYFDSIAACKLYDYDNHKWYDFKEAKFLKNE